MKALALFGSTARCEREIDSDLDLLGVYDKSTIHHSSESIVNLYLYPEQILIQKMVSGDLFALHLVKESLPIYGEGYLKDIYSNFIYKESYKHEINTALFISNILINNYSSIANKFIANKKLAWCVRTIIIAISAQDRNPTFSKKALSEYIKLSTINPKEVLSLINSKIIKHSLPLELIEKYKILLEELYDLYGENCDLSLDPLVSDILANVGLIKLENKNGLATYS